MHVTRAGAGLAFAALALAAGPAAQAVEWPEAIARLAAERTRAVTCAGRARVLGDAAATPLGTAYGEAKAKIDGVVAGLSVALAQGRAPVSLRDLEGRLSAGVRGRKAFCRWVVEQGPPAAPGERGLVGDLVGAALEPLIEAIVAIWQRVDDNDRLRRDTIRAQLEATRWPAFAEVPPSR